MTDTLVVLRKLAILREHLARLRVRRPPDAAAFAADIVLQDAAALSLLVTVQEAADIALHIASDEGWEVPGSFAEAFQVLVQHGVIDAELGRQLAAIAAL